MSVIMAEHRSRVGRVTAMWCRRYAYLDQDGGDAAISETIDLPCTTWHEADITDHRLIYRRGYGTELTTYSDYSFYEFACDTQLRTAVKRWKVITLRASSDAGSANATHEDLFDASERGDLSLVKALISETANVDTRSAKGETPLMVASLRGHREVVEQLLAAGADVSAESDRNITALDIASENGHLGAVQSLLSAGANVGVRALLVAVEGGHADLVRVLVAAGFDPRQIKPPLYRVTPLILAARHGNSEILETLIAAGVDIDARTTDGNTALMEAARRGHIREARALLAAGCKGASELIKASQSGDIDVVQTLLSARVDANASGEHGRTPLLMAAASRSQISPLGVSKTPNSIKILLASGADINCADGSDTTALMEASAPEVVQTLLAAGADVNAATRGGTTALMVASKYCRLSSVECLLAAGANASARDEDGDTALIIAVSGSHDCRNSLEVVKALVAAGADVNAVRNNGVTALSIAVSWSIFDGPGMVQSLLAAGANVNVIGSAGLPPIIVALGHGQCEIVRYLLAAGANANVKETDGNPALTVAISSMKLRAVIPDLLAAGADVNATNNVGDTALIAAARYCDGDLEPDSNRLSNALLG